MFERVSAGIGKILAGLGSNEAPFDVGGFKARLDRNRDLSFIREFGQGQGLLAAIAADKALRYSVTNTKKEGA